MDLLSIGTIQQFQKGDPDAFRVVYDFSKEKIMTYCMQYVLSRESAEELVNDIFLRLWRNREEIDPEIGILGFLFTTAKFETFSYLKKVSNDNKKRAVLTEHYTLKHELQYHDKQFEAAHDLKALKAIINTFPPQRRKVFEYCKFEGLSYAEVSERLNLNKETVKKHMGIALKDLSRMANAGDFVSLMILTGILLNRKYKIRIYYIPTGVIDFLNFLIDYQLFKK